MNLCVPVDQAPQQSYTQCASGLNARMNMLQKLSHARLTGAGLDANHAADRSYTLFKKSSELGISPPSLLLGTAVGRAPRRQCSLQRKNMFHPCAKLRKRHDDLLAGACKDVSQLGGPLVCTDPLGCRDVQGRFHGGDHFILNSEEKNMEK